MQIVLGESRSGERGHNMGIGAGSRGRGAEGRAPGVEEIHIAADRAKGFSAEEVTHRRPEDGERGLLSN
jgi:hypothetical protein